MSAVADRATHWPTFVVRALPALAGGLAVTFNPDHSASFGLLVFGLFAIATGAAHAWSAVRLGDRVLRGVALTQAIVAVAIGAASLLWNGGGLGFMVLVFSSYGAIVGFLELYLGLRSRRRHPASRDWLTSGALTALFAVVVLLIPADLEHHWETSGKPEVVSGVLTADLFVVGTFGAYAVLIGVYLLIAGLSAKWSVPAPSTEPTLSTGVE